jgi:hypothetical protein
VAEETPEPRMAASRREHESRRDFMLSWRRWLVTSLLVTAIAWTFEFVSPDRFPETEANLDAAINSIRIVIDSYQPLNYAAHVYSYDIHASDACNRLPGPLIYYDSIGGPTPEPIPRSNCYLKTLIVAIYRPILRHGNIFITVMATLYLTIVFATSVIPYAIAVEYKNTLIMCITMLLPTVLFPFMASGYAFFFQFVFLIVLGVLGKLAALAFSFSVMLFPVYFFVVTNVERAVTEWVAEKLKKGME